MNLHVFNDTHGFFLNLTVKRFIESDALQNNSFVNLNTRAVFKDSKVKYLKRNRLSFKKYIKALPAIKSVTFYPLDFVASDFLRELKKSQPFIKVNWVFWGYEYYQRPDNYLLNYDSFSSAYYSRDGSIFKNVKKTAAYIIKRILFIPVFNKGSLIKSYSQVEEFYSFLPQDFKNVFQYMKTITCVYHPISFLSIEETNYGIVWGNVTNEIMIGHAAAPTLNHAEILDILCHTPFSGKLFLPLEYGEEQYRNEIKNKANLLFNGRTEFLETRLEMQAYYQRLSSVGFAVFNFRWQESLGNIIFLIWNGTKIFLKKESSVYQQFTAWGLHVFTIEHDLNEENIVELLAMEKRLENRNIIENLFSREKVKKYWKRLM